MRFRPWIVLIALTALLAVYYAIHKPFDVPLIQAWIGFAFDLLPVIFLAIIGGSIGRWLLGRFGLKLESRAERVAVEALLGLGLIAEVTLVIGLLGGFRAAILWPLWLLIGLAMLIGTRASWLRDIVALVKRAFHPETGWSRWLALFVWLMLASGLLMALLPPSAWDALAYHLAGPAHYLANSRISTQANPYLGFPQNLEMLYGLAMGLFGRDTAAAPIHWLFGALALLGTMGMIRRRLGTNGERAAWLTAALLLSSFSVWLLLGWPYVDLAVMAYSAAILIALNRWQQTRRTQWLALAGVMIGMALGVKLTSVALLGAAAVYVAVSDLGVTENVQRRIAWRSWLQSGAILGLFAFAAFLPWMIKGIVLYHNPIYPYVFGGDYWNAARGDRLNELNDAGNGLLGSDRALLWPLLPITATLFGVQSGVNFDFTTGPWLLVLPLLLIMTWSSLRKESGERLLTRSNIAFVVPLFMVWWLIAGITNIGIQTRFMTMAMPSMALLGAVATQGVRRWPIKPINIYFLLQVILTLTFCFSAIDAARWFVQLQGVNYFTGFADRKAVLAVVGASNLIDAMDQAAKFPTGTQVHILWDPRDYFCPSTVKCVVDYALDDWQGSLEHGNTPDQVFSLWKRSGDQYFLVFNTSLDYYSGISRTSAIVSSFMNTFPRWLTPLWTNDAYTLYGWKDTAATF